MSRVMIGVALACLWIAAPSGAAETFEVDSHNDRNDADTGDGICATAAGECTLRAAIDQANATVGSDIVKLPKGTFELTRPTSGGMVDPNAEGDLFVDDAVSIEGKGPGRTVIEQTVSDRVIETEVASLAGLQLTGLEVTGGRLNKPGNQLGGGIFNDGVLLLDRVRVRGNRVIPRAPAGNSFGGGILQAGGLLLITRSTITANRVELESETGSAVGGGVMTLAGVLGLEDSKISSNATKVTGGGTSVGGGLSVRGGTSIINTAITGNRAMEGAGIEVSSSSTDGALTLDSSTVSGNEGRRGGGIYLRTTETHSIVNSTISGNKASKGGSAIYARLGQTDLLHTTVFGNPTKGRRGAIRLAEFVAGLSLTHSIVAGRGDDCRAVDPADLDAGAQNVLGDVTCAEAGLSTDLVANPRLKDLAANPGPDPGFVTRTHALRPSSPAIDFVTGGCPPPATDQRAVTRPQGGACDAGSFEAPG